MFRSYLLSFNQMFRSYLLSFNQMFRNYLLSFNQMFGCCKTYEDVFCFYLKLTDDT